MEQIKITSQEQLDALKEITKEQEVTIEASVELRLGGLLRVYGKLKIYSKLNTAWYGRHVEAWGSSHVEAWGSSHVVARESSHVEAWESSHVVARESSHVVARGQTSIKIISAMFTGAAQLFGSAAIWIPKGLKFKLEIKSKKATKIVYEQEPFLEREGVEVVKGKVILFKRVSKDFQTQEGTVNETIWTVGKTLEHPAWDPTSGECGHGKYHACSRPYFCDEFRSNQGDVYIAIEIAEKDLHEWKNPDYPHKIAFRKGTVLYVCDKYGKKI